MKECKARFGCPLDKGRAKLSGILMAGALEGKSIRLL